MKNTAEAVKDQATKEQAPKAKTPKTKGEPVASVPKATKADSDVEPTDRLPASLEELKATKGGLVSFLFLSDKDKDEIAKELKAAFKLTDDQSVKIVRRITGRARFFKRAFELMAVK